MTNITKILRDSFPQWMAIRNNDSSLGAQFLETFGLQLTDVQTYLSDLQNNYFIGTANVGEVDIIYKAYVDHDILMETPLYITDGEENTITELTRLQDFYKEVGDVAIVDSDNDYVYFRKYYDRVFVNGGEHILELHHVWNAFDEFGMLFDLYRNYGERNEDFKNRILDIFKAPPGDTQQGLTNHLARVLGVGKDKIQIKSLKEVSESEIDVNGNVSHKFLTYVKQLNKLIPFTWDSMRWDDGYWNMFDTIGLDYLPHIYNPDMTIWANEEFQSGIGDNDDLLLEAPVMENPEQTFGYDVGLTGTIDRSEDIYVEHELKYKVYATGQKVSKQKLPQKIYHTSVASEDVPFTYDVKSQLEYERIHTESFDDETYTKSNVEIVHGNKIMSAGNRYIKVKIKLDTDDPAVTPSIANIKVNYTANGVDQNILLDTAEGLTRNDDTGVPYPRVNTTLNSVETTAENTVVLGKGSYSRYYDTVNSWKDGYRENIKSTRAGLTMVLPRERE